MLRRVRHRAQILRSITFFSRVQMGAVPNESNFRGKDFSPSDTITRRRGQYKAKDRKQSNESAITKFLSRRSE